MKALCFSRSRGLSFQEVINALVYLSEQFYSEYGHCPEILKKPLRPYACVAVQVNEHFFAVPFRHHIAQKYAFFTYGTCGLDYTKAVLLLKESYVDTRKPQIEQREFNALKGKDTRIAREFSRYLKLYCKAAQNRESPHYQNIIRYSTLQSFEDYIL